MILRRRTFMLGALSTSVAIGLTERTWASTEPAREILLVRDAGIPEGAQFIRHWPTGAARIVSFDRDVSALLFGQLVPMWREGVAPIAALTDARAFFLLSHAAGDFGLRLTHRCIHVQGDGAMRHEMAGSLNTEPRPGAIDWPSQAASAARTALTDRRGQALPISELLPGEEAMLVSWVMVPRGQVRA